MKKFLALTLFASLNATSHAAPAYLEAWDFIGQRGASAESTYRAYGDMTDALAKGFDQICGDTFCEGDYSNIVSLGITCAVEISTEKVPSCVWSFAGSNAEVDSSSGAINVNDKKFFECKIKVDMNFDDLLKALAPSESNREVINIALPSGQPSFYDQLTDCL
jgi:hypothetical protein